MSKARAGLLSSTSLAAFALLGFATTANAQTLWTGATDSDFSVPGNWDNGAPVAGDTAIVNGDGNSAPDVVSNSTIDTLQLQDGNLTVDGATLSVTSKVEQSGGTLTIETNGVVEAGTYSLKGGSIAGDGTLTSANDFDLQSGTVAAKLSGAGGVAKTGTGDVVLSNADNDYKGTTTVSEGKLTVSAAGALGSDTGDLVVESGGTLDLGTVKHEQGSVLLKDGSSVGNGTLTAFSVGNEGATFFSAYDISGEIEVTAIGGKIDAIGPDGIVATNSAGGITVDTTELGDIDNEAGTGIDVSTTGEGYGIDLGLDGSVQGKTDGVVVSTTAGVGGVADVSIDISDDVTGLEGDGIRVSVDGDSKVTISGSGNVTGGSAPGNDGIQVTLGSGTAEITLKGDISGDPGVTMTSDAGGTFIVNGSGDITGDATGVYLESTNGDGNLTVTQDGSIEGGTNGIEAFTGNATSDGKGAILITADSGETIVGKAGAGVTAKTDDGTITVNGAGDISGTSFGVLAWSAGAMGGDVKIGGAGKTSSSADASFTIDAILSGGGAGEADIVIDRSGAVSNTGGLATAGIVASTNLSGKSNISIDTDGGVTVAGTASFGIFAQIAAGSGTVTIDGDGNVVSTGTGASTGILATNAGTGDIKVTGKGETSTAGDGSITIVASVTGAAGGDIVVDRSGLVKNTGGGATIGVSAISSSTGDGDITVTTGGVEIAGTGSTGINAQIIAAGTGDVLVNSDGDVKSTGKGASVGILANNLGTGKVTVGGTGDTSTSGDGSTTIVAVSNNAAGSDVVVDRSGLVSNTGGSKTVGVNAGSYSLTGGVTVTTGGVEIAGADSIGINAQMLVAGTGDVLVNGSGDVKSTGTGASAAIVATSAGSGKVTVSGGGDTSTQGATSITILAAATGAGGGDVLVDRSGLVKNTGTGATTGIKATSASTVGGVTVTTGGVEIGGADSVGIDAGITAAGDGDVMVDGSGDVKSTGSGASIGIRASNAGSGTVTVGGSGKTSTSGETSQTIVALGLGAAAGDVSVIRSGLVENTGTGATVGINVLTNGLDSDLTVTADGGVTMAGIGSVAVNAQILSASATGGIVVDGTGAIVSTGTGASYGIQAVNAGKGTIDIDSGAITLADKSEGAAIAAISKNGGIVTVDNGGAINGGAVGILASSAGAGTVTVTTGATIGLTDATWQAGIALIVVDGQAQANVGHAIKTDGVGVNATGSGTGLIDINQSSGKITAGTIGIYASQTSTGGIDIDLTGKAVIDAAEIGVRVDGALTSATLDIGVDNVVGGAVNAVQSSAQTFVVNNSGTVTSNTTVATSKALDVLSGSTTFTNLSGGKAFGMIGSGAAATALTVNNNFGATWTFNDNGIAALDGSAEEIANAGLLRASGTSTLTGLETFDNQAGGVFEINQARGPGAVVTFADLGTFANKGSIDLANSPTGGPIVVDTLVLDGNYDGTDGSTINVDIDLAGNNPGGTPRLSDQLVVTNGAFTGKSTVAFNLVNTSNLGLQDSPIIVVDLDASQANTGVFDAVGLPATGGIIEYQFGQIGEDWGVTSTVNLSVAGGLSANIALAQSIIGTVVNRPSSPYVSGLAGKEDYYVGPAVWMRGVGGGANVSAGVTDNFGFASKAEVDLTYLGAQVGADLGWFNIEGTDLAINAGFTGGYNAGTTRQDVISTFNGSVTGITEGDFESRFAGAYLTVAKGRIFADIQARFDNTDFTFNNSNPLVGLNESDVDSKRFSMNGSVGYAAKLGNDFTFVPSIGLSYSHIQTGDVAFDNGSTLAPRSYDSWMVFAGGTLARTFVMPDEVSAVSPFVTGTLYSDFGDDPTSVYTFGDAQRIITTENLGTFGEVSLGADYVRVFATGREGHPPKQLNANLRGDFKFSDRLLAVGVNAQMRLQF